MHTLTFNKSIQIIKWLLVLLFFFGTNGGAIAQSKFEKKSKQAELLCEQGYLLKAFKLNDKIIKKAKKSNLKEDRYMYGKALLRKARMEGQLRYSKSEFSYELKQGLQVIKNSFGKDSEEYEEGLLEKCEALFAGGYYIDTHKSLSELNTHKKKLNPELEYRIKTLYIKLLGFEGEYQDAFTEISVLDKKQKGSHLHQHLALMNLKVYLLIEKGDYAEAQKVWSINNQEIKSKMKKNSWHEAELHFLKGLIHLRKKEYMKSYYGLEEAFDMGTKYNYPQVFSIHAVSMNDVVDEFAETLYQMGDGKFIESVFSEYTKGLKKKVGFSNLYNQREQLIALREWYYTGGADDVCTEVDYILKEKNDMFRSPVFRSELLTLELRALDQLERERVTEAVLKQLEDELKKMYPANSLALVELSLEQALHNVRVHGESKEAFDVFSGSTFKRYQSQKSPAHEQMIKFSNTLGHLYLRFEYLDSARVLYAAQLPFIEKNYGQDNIVRANQYLEFAMVSFELGDYSNAEKYFSLADGMYQSFFKTDPTYISLLEALADYYLELKYLEEAQEVLVEVEANRRITDDESSVREQLERASVYIKAGKFKGVDDLLNSAHEAALESYGEDSEVLLEVFYHKLEFGLSVGDIAAVEQNLQEMEVLCDKHYERKSLKRARFTFMQARVKSFLGDYQRSLVLYEEVLEIRSRKLKETHLDIARCLQEIALTKLLLDEPEMVSSYLKRSEKVILQAVEKESRLYADQLKKEAFYYMHMKQYAIAKSKLAIAYTILSKYDRKVKRNVALAEVVRLLGETSLRQGEYKDAEGYFLKAKASYRKLFGEKHPEYLHILGDLAVTYHKQDRVDLAIEMLDETTLAYLEYLNEYFPTLSERDKAKFWSKMRPDFAYYNSLILEHHQEYPNMIGHVYDNIIATKSILLKSSRKMRSKIVTSGSPVLLETYDEWLEKKELLGTVVGMSDEDAMASGVNKKELLTEVETLEKYLSKNASYVLEEQVAWTDIRDALEPGEVAIEILRLQPDPDKREKVMYAALILRASKKQKIPEVVLLKNGFDLENRLFKMYKNAFKYKIEDKKSFVNYWQPIQKKLSKEKVYLSVDGIYNLIALEALKSPNGAYVLDQNDLVLTGNTGDVLARSDDKKQRSKSATLLGGPSFYTSGTGSVSPLPGSVSEVQDLEKILKSKGWKVSQLVGAEASESKLRTSSSTVVHLATHGFFGMKGLNEDAMSSTFVNPSLLKTGLVLAEGGALIDSKESVMSSDGVLTSYEAMDLNYDGTELVVLSACNTGVGDWTMGEGVFGLQRSFLAAGADNVMMSLFKVPDAATAELMNLFYADWIKTGDKHHALKYAKIQLRKKYPHPFYWGSFVLVGASE